MSRAPYASLNARFGVKMGDARMTDMMLGALNDPFGGGHMGITAENVAKKYQISRTQQDAFAAESHKRATAAIKAGHFKDQILPIEVKVGREMNMFAMTLLKKVLPGCAPSSIKKVLLLPAILRASMMAEQPWF